MLKDILNSKSKGVLPEDYIQQFYFTAKKGETLLVIKARLRNNTDTSQIPYFGPSDPHKNKDEAILIDEKVDVSYRLQGQAGKITIVTKDIPVDFRSRSIALEPAKPQESFVQVFVYEVPYKSKLFKLRIGSMSTIVDVSNLLSSNLSRL